MSIISFGRFKDHDIEEIPSDYLTWLLETDWFEKQYSHLITEIDQELDFRSRHRLHFYKDAK